MVKFQQPCSSSPNCEVLQYRLLKLERVAKCIEEQELEASSQLKQNLLKFLRQKFVPKYIGYPHLKLNHPKLYVSGLVFFKQGMRWKVF